jgi:hypothetical protein
LSPAGRIDAVLFADGRPVVAIENKVAARMGDDQLFRYGQWIRKSAPANAPAIVCLLTHLTKAPDGFVEGWQSGGATPQIVKWGAIGAAFRELAQGHENVSADIRMLAGELFMFLGEAEMSHEYAGRDEFAAALVYLRAGARMDHTFSSIYYHLKSLKGCFHKSELSREFSLLFDTKINLIWGWTYLAHSSLSGLFFGYGIALDPRMTFNQDGVPERDSVFLCLGAEEKRSIQSVRASKEEPQKPWIFVEMRDWVTVISFRPLHDFMAEPEKFAAQMIEWIDSQAADVNAFVSKLK